MYDYERYQHWWNGRLIEDYLDTRMKYGHIYYENASKFDFENGFEPVSPYGCEMFQNGEYRTSIIIPELGVEVVGHHTKPPTYHDVTLQNGEFIIVKEINAEKIPYWSEDQEKLKREFDHIKARDARLQFYTKKYESRESEDYTYSEFLQTEVPIDMSMVY